MESSHTHRHRPHWSQERERHRRTMPMDLHQSIFVAGHRGLVGSALCRKLAAEGFDRVLTASRSELDLCRQADVERWFEENRPDHVFLVAGTVGGILANASRQAEFLYDNMLIHVNVIEAARRVGVKKLLYLGSACAYPRLSKQPISEDELLTGPLEPTNEGYALAKISGLRLCDYYREQYGCNFITAMPTNLYGPNDNFDLESSHVLPALMRKFDEAKASGEAQVPIWGTGSARREFMHVDDMADACVFLMDNYDKAGHINVGTGVDVSIADLAETIGEIVYPEAELRWDPSKPDGMPRRVLDVSRLAALGWQATIELSEGIEATYRWYVENGAQRRTHGERSVVSSR